MGGTFSGVCLTLPFDFLIDKDTYDDLFYVLPDDSAYDGAIVDLGAGEYVVASYDGPYPGLGSAHASLVAFACSRGLRANLPRYEISALKLLDREDRYRCTIEMRALGV
jgi:effector-binding domain-containing protein